MQAALSQHRREEARLRMELALERERCAARLTEPRLTLGGRVHARGDVSRAAGHPFLRALQARRAPAAPGCIRRRGWGVGGVGHAPCLSPPARRVRRPCRGLVRHRHGSRGPAGSPLSLSSCALALASPSHSTGSPSPPTGGGISDRGGGWVGGWVGGSQARGAGGGAAAGPRLSPAAGAGLDAGGHACAAAATMHNPPLSLSLSLFPPPPSPSLRSLSLSLPSPLPPVSLPNLPPPPPSPPSPGALSLSLVSCSLTPIRRSPRLATIAPSLGNQIFTLTR